MDTNTNSPLGGEHTREQLVIIVSLGLILLSLLFREFNYRTLSDSVTLLFYAVVVQIWTEFTGDDPVFVNRDWQFIEFIISGIGAVIVGYLILTSIEQATGDIVAVQSLALIAIISRAYSNLKHSNTLTLKEALQYQDPVDRYLVLVPALVAFCFPIAVSHLSWQPIVIESTRGFIEVVAFSLASGITVYTYEVEGMGKNLISP